MSDSKDHHSRKRTPGQALRALREREGQARQADRKRFANPAEVELGLKPDLISAIRADLATMGLVEETDKGLLVYSCYSSRKRPHPSPLSVSIKGPPGSGKDSIQRTPALLIPTQDVVNLMGLTPQYLAYAPPGSLKNKAVLGGERSQEDSPEQRDRTRNLRQMMSHGYITRGTVEQQKAKELRSEGPMSYSETTTLPSIFSEDADRVLEITTDTSPEHIRAIKVGLASLKLPGAGGSIESMRADVIRRHHEYQDSLINVDMRIPYAVTLAETMPDTSAAIRASMLVIRLIEVIAYLHQHSRELNEHGQLLATMSDYGLARQLLIGPMGIRLGDGADHQQMCDYYLRLRETLSEADQFDTVQGEKVLNIKHRQQTIRILEGLVQLGVILKVKEGIGPRPAVWHFTGNEVDTVLPTVNQLMSALAGR